MTFLTEYTHMDTGLLMAGPRIYAYSWDDAEYMLDVFVCRGLIHPRTQISGELVEEGTL